MTTENQSQPSPVTENQENDVPIRWRHSSTSRKRRLSRLVIPAFLALAICGGVGGTLGLFSFVRATPDPFFVPVWTSQSAITDVGLHAPIENDRLALASERVFGNFDSQIGFDPGRRLILEQLDQLKERSRKEAVVVYLSATAAIDIQGDVFLFTSDSDPSIKPDRIYLRQILKRVKACRSTKKLLVLDICWPIGIPSLGIFSDDVASKIHGELEQVEDPNLLCISSCSPGQTGWTLLEPRRSVFGYFFERGLLGGADGFNRESKNGRVSVQELSDYLTGHVDEYTSIVCPQRQTPKIFGDGRDFDLVACSAKRHPEFEAIETASKQLPIWLMDAWAQRDKVVEAQAALIDPLFVRQFESEIIRAEMNWRRGGDGERIKTTLEANLIMLTKQYQAGVAMISDPTQEDTVGSVQFQRLASRSQDQGAPSATERATSEDPDAADKSKQDVSPKDSLQAAKDDSIDKDAEMQSQSEMIHEKLDQFLDDLVELVEVTPEPGLPAAKLKLTKQFDSNTAGVSASRLGEELFAYLVQRPSVKLKEIGTLCELWTERFPKAVDIKSAVLVELQQQLARRGSNWDARQIQGALKVIGASERGFQNVLAWQWLGPIKTDLDEQRYIIETLLWYPGHVSPEELESRVRKALILAQRVAALGRRLNDAMESQQIALWRLPQFHSLLTFSSTRTRQWVAAADYAAQLNSLLDPNNPEADGMEADDSKRNGLLEAIAKRVEDLAIDLDPLQTVYAQLLARFETEQIESLLEDAKTPGADATTLRRLSQLLSTPFLDASYRRAVHNASVELSGRLHQASLQSYSPSILCARTGIVGENLAISLEQAAEREENRRQFTLGLLRLAGVDIEEDSIGDPKCEVNILSQWNHAISESKKGSCDLEVRERIQKSLLVESIRSGELPLFERRRTIAQESWIHTASLYKKLSRDSPLADIYQGLSQRYRNAAGGNPDFALRVSPSSSLPDLVLGSGLRSETLVEFHANRPASSSRFLNASTRGVANTSLNRSPTTEADIFPTRNRAVEVSSLLRPGRSELELDVEIDSATNPDQLAQIEGFFVELVRDDQHFLHRVDLPGTGATDPVEVYFGTGSNVDDIVSSASSEIRLRPSNERQPIGFFIRNLRDQAQELEVSVEKQTAQVKLAPRQVKRVEFSGKPPKPNEPLGQLSGPIHVEVKDVAQDQLILDRRYQVVVASPREYVEVIRARFIPYSGGRNRLEVSVRATKRLEGPECTAELVLDPESIPGLVSIAGGRIRGIVPVDGTPLKLYAENLKLTELPDEKGKFSVSIDGVPRTFVFRGSFPRQGNAITPERIVKPGLRVVANPVGLAGPGFPVKLETTNAPLGSDVELEVKRPEGDEKPDLSFSFESPFRTNVGFSPFGNGEMLFTASIQDWSIDLNATHLVGRRSLSAELKDRGIGIALNSIPVSLDDEAPRAVRFDDLPRRVPTAQTRPLQISALSELTGIESVKVFIGQPNADLSIPEKVKWFTGRLLQPDGTLWAVDVEMPKKPGELALTAVATNGAGLKTFETRRLEVVDAKEFDVGDVTGQVFEGVRRQPGLEVGVFDEKGQLVQKAKTEFDGRFEFKALPSGTYVIRSAKPATQRHGAVRVKVRAGQTTQADISLRM